MNSFLSNAVRETWIEGEAGQLYVRHLPAAGQAIASLVICHGLNAHSGHYERAAEVFAQRGLAVTTFDLRGHGRSEGERFYIDAIDNYVSDLSRVIEFARSNAPDLPLYVLGHSAGGLTAVTYALDHQDRIDGLICESFAYRLPAPDIALTLLRGVSHIAPHAHVLRLNPADFSRDPAWVKHLGEDPMIHDEVQPVQTIAALARASERLEHESGRITLPVIILHGTADQAARFEGSEEFFAAVGSADKTLKLYDGYAHDLINDIGRDRVTNDIGNWIEQHAARGPGRLRVA